MKIIKLNTTNSTNSFLKNLTRRSVLENYTTVVAKKQTKGRGQANNKWDSEPCMNLTLSIFIKYNNLKIFEKKYINYAVSMAIYTVIINKKVPNVYVKWPNDIVADNKKICGILVENTFLGKQIKNSIIGIGLNVNQEKFPHFLKNATSLKITTLTDHNLNSLLSEVVLSIKSKIKLLELKQFDVLEKEYLDALYRKNIPTKFKNSKNKTFVGKIIGVSKAGKLRVELENNSIEEFENKEISIV